MKHLVLLAIVPFSVSATECAPGMGVQFPFRTEVARSNFAKCLGASSPPEAKLKRIESVCYLAEPALPGCQPGSTDCKAGDTHFKGIRSLSIGVQDEIAPDAVKKSLQSRQKDGCDKFLLSSFNGGVEHRKAVFDFAFSIKDRACDKYLGTHDLCKGRVSGRYQAVLSDKLDLSSESFKTGSSGKCFGVIPYDSVPKILDISVQSLIGLGSIVFSSNFLLNSGWTSLPSTTLEGPADTKLPNTQLTSMDYTPDFIGSGFKEKQFDDGTNRYVIDYSEFGYLDGFLRNIYVSERKREIKFLQRLGNTEAEVVEVAKGDSLSRIAENFYGDPQLFLVLDKVNLLKGRKLQPGENLVVPQPHQICELFLHNSGVVRHGQSVWGKTKNGDIAPGTTKSDVYSGNLNLIYPYELLKDISLDH